MKTLVEAIEELKAKCAMPFGTELREDDGDIRVTLPSSRAFLISGQAVRDNLHVFRFNAQMARP